MGSVLLRVVCTRTEYIYRPSSWCLQRIGELSSREAPHIWCQKCCEWTFSFKDALHLWFRLTGPAPLLPEAQWLLLRTLCSSDSSLHSLGPPSKSLQASLFLSRFRPSFKTQVQGPLAYPGQAAAEPAPPPSPETLALSSHVEVPVWTHSGTPAVAELPLKVLSLIFNSLWSISTETAFSFQSVPLLSFLLRRLHAQGHISLSPVLSIFLSDPSCPSYQTPQRLPYSLDTLRTQGFSSFCVFRQLTSYSAALVVASVALSTVIVFFGNGGSCHLLTKDLPLFPTFVPTISAPAHRKCCDSSRMSPLVHTTLLSSLSSHLGRPTVL